MYHTTCDALNDVRNLEVPVRAAKANGLHTVAGFVYTESPVHTDEYYSGKIREMVALGIDGVFLKDPGVPPPSCRPPSGPVAACLYRSTATASPGSCRTSWSSASSGARTQCTWRPRPWPTVHRTFDGTVRAQCSSCRLRCRQSITNAIGDLPQAHETLRSGPVEHLAKSGRVALRAAPYLILNLHAGRGSEVAS